MRWVALKKAIKGVYRDVNCNHTFAIAAGLSYYFLMSLFPLLIFAAAALAFIPIPNLFDEVLGLMSRFIPQQSMGLVQEIVKNVMLPPRTGLLSFGFVVTIWAATGGFAAMIEALNIAYDVEETRPYWRVRVLALQLTLTIGALVIFSLALTLIGPRFGEWLNAHGKVGPYFAFVWPLIRWVMIFIAVVFAVEMLYFMAPNVKQKFLYTLPGAVLSVGVWIIASELLGVYIRDYWNSSATYGALGSVIGLMLWFYISALTLLLGAEINNELLKAKGILLQRKERKGKQVEEVCKTPVERLEAA